MSVKKAVEVIFVDAIPKSRSGIGRDVPAHVKLEWIDERGRKRTHYPDLSPITTALIQALPDAKDPMEPLLECMFKGSRMRSKPDCGPVTHVARLNRIDGRVEQTGYCEKCYQEVFGGHPDATK